MDDPGAPWHAPESMREPLRALAEKYALLVRLREERDAGADAAPRAVLFPLATRFPGALRELETVPMDELYAREKALRALSETGAEARVWMRWSESYHRWMRAALGVKRAVAGGREVDDAALVERAEKVVGAAISLAWVQAVRRPERGRLRPLVLAEVARECGAEPGALTRWLLLVAPPPRR